jgi:hypothetical protein
MALCRAGERDRPDLRSAKTKEELSDLAKKHWLSKTG